MYRTSRVPLLARLSRGGRRRAQLRSSQRAGGRGRGRRPLKAQRLVRPLAKIPYQEARTIPKIANQEARTIPGYETFQLHEVIRYRAQR